VRAFPPQMLIRAVLVAILVVIVMTAIGGLIVWAVQRALLGGAFDNLAVPQPTQEELPLRMYRDERGRLRMLEAGDWRWPSTKPVPRGCVRSSNNHITCYSSPP